MSTSQLSPGLESRDQHSFQSGSSESSINANRRLLGNQMLLEIVVDHMHRAILPVLENWKQEHKDQRSREEFDQGRSYNSPFELRSERDISEETVIRGEEKPFRERSEEHRLKDAAAGAAVVEFLTAAALNRHDIRHDDSRSCANRKKRSIRGSKGSTRISEAFQKAEGGSQ